ncbi:hypothetical protein PRIPAC_70919 [Pristionchus pacificus]|uniref:Uncharacterized protein n=1 Tax=Pristionchus pacificus TaxID=54126 RepID=A0A2A6C721_PRIPA|nr:hypothetical protein PRIPAC_70919 [Pristionchus pacificus]|eukprot:PDM73917.1 hypothetical protein PRIPAC_41273 [Pristionchus pacificus]
MAATWSGFSLPSNKGNHKIAAYRICGDPDSIVSYRFKEKVDGDEVPIRNRKAKSEWMTHPETMFCKFMIERHRTTNLVESWHRGLISYFLGHHPPLMELVNFLLKTELDDNISMKHYRDNGSSYELSDDDEKRSIETLSPMIEFHSIICDKDPSNDEILSYLDRMTKFCHEKLN